MVHTGEAGRQAAGFMVLTTARRPPFWSAATAPSADGRSYPTAARSPGRLDRHAGSSTARYERKRHAPTRSGPVRWGGRAVALALLPARACWGGGVSTTYYTPTSAKSSWKAEGGPPRPGVEAGNTGAVAPAAVRPLVCANRGKGGRGHVLRAGARRLGQCRAASPRRSKTSTLDRRTIDRGGGAGARRCTSWALPLARTFIRNGSANSRDSPARTAFSRAPRAPRDRTIPGGASPLSGGAGRPGHETCSWPSPGACRIRKRLRGPTMPRRATPRWCGQLRGPSAGGPANGLALVGPAAERSPLTRRPARCVDEMPSGSPSSQRRVAGRLRNRPAAPGREAGERAGSGSSVALRRGPDHASWPPRRSLAACWPSGQRGIAEPSCRSTVAGCDSSGLRGRRSQALRLFLARRLHRHGRAPLSRPPVPPPCG